MYQVDSVASGDTPRCPKRREGASFASSFLFGGIVPIYEFECGNCAHRFSEIQDIGNDSASCPKCGGQGRKLISAPARIIVNSVESLPYGSGSRGRYVPSEKGRRDILVPSFGTMEKEEIDYVVEVAQGQEDERIKRQENSMQKQRLERLVGAARYAPAGQRAKTAREIIGG
jgi:putative FmdB family regulatory protein|tara:strand:- start:5888 stop:6403 length:516 start_codon:yes stop_codon:yes gene_type:complete